MRFIKLSILCFACFVVAFTYLISNVFDTYITKGGNHGREQNPGVVRKKISPNKLEKKASGSVVQRRLPQVIGIGVKKCGTGALRNFLSNHPNIKFPVITEPHFFDNNSSYNKGQEHYRLMMPPTREHEITMEITPKYYVTEWVPGRIQKLYDEASKRLKLVVVLCNPVDRIYSEYVHTRTSSQISKGRYYLENQVAKYSSVSHLAEVLLHNITSSNFKRVDDIVRTGGNPAFEKFIRDKYEISLITNGIYAFHMERWYTYFTPEQILVVSGETLIKEPWVAIDRVQNFLGISRVLKKDNFVMDEKKGFYCIDQCMGSGKGRTRSLTSVNKTPYPPLSSKIRDSLENFYRPFNEILSKLCNKPFKW